MGIAGAPGQVRNHGAAGTETRYGPFLRASLPVAGFTIIEPPVFDEALEMASQTPERAAVSARWRSPPTPGGRRRALVRILRQLSAVLPTPAVRLPKSSVAIHSNSDPAISSEPSASDPVPLSDSSTIVMSALAPA